MLLDHREKQLDFQFILWRFETKNLNMTKLQKVDNGLEGGRHEDEDIDSIDSEGNAVERRQVEKIQGSSCCTIF